MQTKNQINSNSKPKLQNRKIKSKIPKLKTNKVPSVTQRTFEGKIAMLYPLMVLNRTGCKQIFIHLNLKWEGKSQATPNAKKNTRNFFGF